MCATDQDDTAGTEPLKGTIEALAPANVVDATVMVVTAGPVDGDPLGQKSEVVVPDSARSDGFGGFLWKFPSEGSNKNPGDNADVPDRDSLDDYPRQCIVCRAWVSSYANERRHLRICAKDVNTKIDENQQQIKLGTPRRFWCEVDSSLSRLQWRPEVESAQDTTLCCIPFVSMARITTGDDPVDSLHIYTTEGRQIVFQHRNDSSASRVSPGVREWCEYLRVLSSFTRETPRFGRNDDVKACGVESDTTDERKDGDENNILLAQITRAMTRCDVAGLEDLLSLEDEHALGRNIRDTRGNSLLMIAIRCGANEHVVRKLLNVFVDVNAKNSDGESPLLLVAASGELTQLQVLLHAESIKVNQRCALGATAFHAAANAGSVSAMRLLCASGANASMVDENGWTALHYAAACASGLDAVRFLCELAPDLLDRPCTMGNTPLHVAAGYGCEDNVRTLLETAANPHVLNSDGQTAYRVALQSHHIHCAVRIHEYMSNPPTMYEQPTPRFPIKADEITPVEYATSTACVYSGGYSECPTTSLWSECMTDDGLTYFYNHVTGESTWHRPTDLGCAEQEGFSAGESLPQSAPLQGSRAPCAEQPIAENGHKLPVCLIPLISPLVSLDDPTAADKFDARRRKARAQRRSKLLKHRSRRLFAESVALHPPDSSLSPPPPPIRFAASSIY